jgi:SAM-dependent methyltransferase
LSLNIHRQRERLPAFLPEWIKRRVATDIYLLRDFSQQVAASLPPDIRILDAGAGEGQYKSFFAHTRYVGVDLAIGDQTWNYNKLDALCDLVRLPFAANSFDAVLCTQVLEHVQEPLQILQDITRVLKPGGSLYLTAPQSWHQHQKPHDYFRYTSYGLRYLFERAGLQASSIQPMGGYFWFLSFQLQNINYWLFSKRSTNPWWTWPLRAILGLLFQLLLPLPLYYLDVLDRTKDETFGYLCVAVKPASGV